MATAAVKDSHMAGLKESSASDTSKSKKSRSTTNSSLSSSKRAEMKKRQLMVAQEALKRKQELEQKSLQLQQEKERLEIETELQLNQLDLEAKSEDCSSKGSIDLSIADNNFDKVSRWLTLDQLDPDVSPNGQMDQASPTQGQVIQDAPLFQSPIQTLHPPHVTQFPDLMPSNHDTSTNPFLNSTNPFVNYMSPSPPTQGPYFPPVQQLPPWQLPLYMPSSPEMPLPYGSIIDSPQPVQNVSASPDSDSSKHIVDLVKEQGSLTKLLLEQHTRAILPQRSITPFSGDALEYVSFTHSFHHNIESKLSDERERYYYLEHFTNGDANRLVKSCMRLENPYTKAKELLAKKFGDGYKIAQAFVNKATSWPNVKADDPDELNKLAFFLMECNNVLDELSYDNELNHTANIKAIVMKLPYRLRDKWRGLADRIMESGQRVKFSNLVEFIDNQARILMNPIYGDVVTPRDKRDNNNSTKIEPARRFRSSFATNATHSIDQPRTRQSETHATSPVSNAICLYCDKSHDLSVCRKLQSEPNQRRIEFIKSKGLCFGCLKRAFHFSRECANRLVCKVCSKPHPTVLHRDVASTQGPDPQERIRSASSKCTIAIGAGTPALVPIKVRSRETGKIITTYAFLDDGSNAVFCSESLRADLGIKGKRSKLQISTLLEDKEVDTHVLSDLQVMDINERTIIDLPHVYSQDKMPVSLSDVLTSDDIKQWPYLNHIELPDLRHEAKEVGLLIGSNVPKATEPWELVHSQDDGPYAYKTLLGWIVAGIKLKAPIMSNRIHVKVDLHQQLVSMFNHEFNERTIDDVPERSHEDQRFIDSVNSTVLLNDGHYEIGLPLRDQNANLPINKVRAEERASHLKVKFKKNPEFCDEYTKFMTDMMDNKHAERVPLDCVDNDRRWYIPHHGVFHPQKRKLRVVFDCSARYRGVSLNDRLLQGPDLTSSLLGVLTRFRQDPIAIMADIKSMFYQVGVPECDRDLLRFLWWPKGDLQKPLEEYRMKVHPFGATSSPSCANFALRKIAEEHHDLNPKVSRVIQRNFYVDDCLCSVPTETDGVKLAGELREMCKRGGFHLTKWASNNRDVLESIPKMERAKEYNELDLEHDMLPTERALGMLWNAETDNFGYKLEIKQHPHTRRGILSCVSAMYDPLGFIGPALIPAKKIMQELCRLQLGWDDQIPSESLVRWQDWLQDIPRLSSFNVPRCFRPSYFGDPVETQLHHFCDASESAYGAVSYLRLINNHGNIHCRIVLGKARVTPLKQVSIPRLELTAATVAVRVDNLIKKEFDLKIDRTWFWTDSTTVLRYLNNQKARFHTFVANRIAVIKEASKPEQWRYVPTAQNPADDCSRGMKVDSLLKSSRWIAGPEFLQGPECQWPENIVSDHNMEIQDDPEVKKATVAAVVQIQKENSIDKLMTRYSHWHDLKIAVAWILRVKSHLMYKIRDRDNDNNAKVVRNLNATNPLTITEIKNAENAIIKYEQGRCFSEEMKTCRNDGQKALPLLVKKTSSLYRLSPIMDENIMRVGGRLSRSALPEETKFPAILPKGSHITELILRDIHVNTGHGGRNHMLARLRSRYWVVGANAAARKIINSCVTCRRQKAKVSQQMMADLPEDRLIPDDPPFTKVGMDCFGPFEIKRGRSLVKRYGVIFTCLTTRAVHLEKANSLDTDSCINAIRRFIARRGQVREIRSDNGTNFVGAEKILRQEIQKWNQSKLHGTLLQRNIQWKFNPPAGSHMGGVWERQIRTVRKVMTSVVKEQTMTDESLSTLFCEVEAIINSRPLTAVHSETDDLEALTPNHLLLLKGKPNLPPGTFEATEQYSKRRWKQVQYLAELFWTRWSREYITQLQERQKWLRPMPNLKVGDIVLVTDKSKPRNLWPLGRITSTMPDKDGLVRQVEVKTKWTTLIRPIAKLCLLLEADHLDCSEPTENGNQQKVEATHNQPDKVKVCDKTEEQVRAKRVRKPVQRLDL